MNRDPLPDARALVTDLFPHNRWALLAGSVTTAQRTTGSDLDIVVLLPDGDQQAPHRDSRRYRGWPVELFVHDPQSLDHYLHKDLPNRRPVMHRMLATGVPVTGGSETLADSLRCRPGRGAGSAAPPRTRARPLLPHRPARRPHPRHRSR